MCCTRFGCAGAECFRRRQPTGPGLVEVSGKSPDPSRWVAGTWGAAPAMIAGSAPRLTAFARVRQVGRRTAPEAILPGLQHPHAAHHRLAAPGIRLCRFWLHGWRLRRCGAPYRLGRGAAPGRPALARSEEPTDHSHSIVAGGLELTSYTTRFTPFTSLMIRPDIRPSTSCGKWNQSAVMPSVLVTARNATTFSYVR